MKFLKIEYIKKQLRIDGDDEDELLQLYGRDAEATLLNVLGRSFAEVVAEYGTDSEPFPAPLVQAALMLVEVSYTQRSPVTVQNLYAVPYAFDMKVKPYMRLADDVASFNDVPIGTQLKIAFSLDLANGFHMQDVDWTVSIRNMAKNKSVERTKAECIMLSNDGYVVKVDSTELGVGEYTLRVTVNIPDNDFEAGYRVEKYDINPNINVTL